MTRPSMDELKMAWGFLLLFIVAFLIGLIAIGKVEQSTSWGLDRVLDLLEVLGGGWAAWTFATKDRPKDDSQSTKEIQK